MRAVIQRVSQAKVIVSDSTVATINKGHVVLLGVGVGDKEKDADYLAEKVAFLRIFEDEDGKMNRSLLDVGGEALVVSQFTLYGDTRKGRRPGFTDAAPPEEANRLYEYFCRQLAEYGIRVSKGIFQASMSVSLVNEGPVTILLDSRKMF